MSRDSSYIEANNRERERLRALVARITDDELRRMVTDRWTVADMLGHMAFWDARALALARKLDAGVPFTSGDHESEDVDPINATAYELVNAMPPRQVAELAVRMADETDRRVAALAPDRMWPEDPDSPLNPRRAGHRSEHLDHIEAALGADR
jgi:hypothetical protein